MSVRLDITEYCTRRSTDYACSTVYAWTIDQDRQVDGWEDVRNLRIELHYDVPTTMLHGRLVL